MNIPKYAEMYRKDLELKNYATNSINNYVSQVKLFMSEHTNFTEPCKINEDAIKLWLLKASSINGRKHRLSALKLFYKFTVRQPMKLKYIEYPRGEKKLPQPLDMSEIQAILNVCENIKHKAIIMLMISTGVRVSEVINLRITDIDSTRMVINIIRGKGMKDRIVALNPKLLEFLRYYYKKYRPTEYLFNGQSSSQYTPRSVNEFLKHYAQKARIKRNIHAHLLRHSAFTNMVESGVDMAIIQKLAGHQNIATTLGYAHISSGLINRVYNPLSVLV
jgi:site-specific recombinase XerD